MMNEPKVKRLVDAIYTELSAGVTAGIADNEIPAKMLESLQNDVFVFSGCKTYCELKEVSSLLVDENNHIKPFYSFAKDVQAIYEKYNVNYLEAEYEFAVGSAQMAAKWADFEADGNRYNLQYRTAGDDKVRHTHRVLHGTTRPLGDVFWDEYYPPNGWRCRCNVVQVRAGKYPLTDADAAIAAGKEATTDIAPDGRNRAAMFRFNSGKQKVIFPRHHPYYKVKSQISSILEGLQENTSQLVEERQKEYEAYSKNEAYANVLFNEKTGGLQATHKEHNFDPRKGHYEKATRDALYRNGDKVILEAEKGLYKVKTSDGLLNGLKMDIKAIEGAGNNTIKNALNTARKQGAEHVVLYYPESGLFNIDNLTKGWARYIGANKSNPIKKVSYIVNGQVHTLRL